MDAPNKRSKYHHYVPAGLIRRFAAADGRIWQHDKEQRFGPARRRPEDVAGETHLYAPLVSGERIGDDVEQWLAKHVDNEVGRSLDLIEEMSPAFCRSDRLAVARFLAALDMRTPRSRDWLQPLFEEAMRAAIRDDKAAQRGIFWEHGQVIPLDEIRAIASANSEAVVGEHLPTSWLGYIKQIMPLATWRIARGSWSLVRAPSGAEFVTSDLAIGKLSDLATFAPHNFGFLGEITSWAIPISPRNALVVSGEPGDDRVFDAEVAWVDALNSQLAADTPRFVYARSRNDPSRLFSRR